MQPWHCTLTLTAPCVAAGSAATSPKLGQGSPGPGWSDWAQPALSGCVWELAALRTRRLPSADMQLYLTIDPEAEGAGS